MVEHGYCVEEIRTFFEDDDGGSSSPECCHVRLLDLTLNFEVRPVIGGGKAGKSIPRPFLRFSGTALCSLDAKQCRYGELVLASGKLRRSVESFARPNIPMILELVRTAITSSTFRFPRCH